LDHQKTAFREQGTGSTGTESALIFFLMTRQEWFLLVKGRRQLLKGY